eukprot:Skav210258  [mRNA]  locus=scaffold1929:247899:250591:- [translate_table: standard]
MFIDGAFYSDMRQSSAVDYARELVEWIQKVGLPKLKDEPFRTMAERFCDLEKIPFGEKSCYIRQGDIEHLMYFTGDVPWIPELEDEVSVKAPCLAMLKLCLLRDLQRRLKVTARGPTGEMLTKPAAQLFLVAVEDEVTGSPVAR